MRQVKFMGRKERFMALLGIISFILLINVLHSWRREHLRLRLSTEHRSQREPGSQKGVERSVLRYQAVRHPDREPVLDRERVDVLQQSKQTRDRLHQYENIHWVSGGNGTLLQRIKEYNSAIAELRESLLGMQEEDARRSRYSNLSLSTWTDVQPLLNVIWGNINDTIYHMYNASEIHTVALEWLAWEGPYAEWSSLSDHSNVHIQTYYEWTGSQPICIWMESEGMTRARWNAAYNQKCNINGSNTIYPKSLDLVYFRAKPINTQFYWPNYGVSYPKEYYVTVPDYVFYVHLARNAVITPSGDLISGNIKIVHYGCSHDVSTEVANYTSTPIYNEVFVMTQFWGAEFFHLMCESLPRIIPYLEFLRERPSIKIHVANTGGTTAKLLWILGISPERLVTGLSRAKLVYQPQGSYCGFAHVQATQLASHWFRQYIYERYPIVERNSIVVIHRSGGRRFAYHQEIEHSISLMATEYDHHFEIFTDQPTPTLEESMQMFQRAVLVVAPHGAGLSNLIFSEPGTYVIEGVCNPPHVNMCYQRLAHILGMHYHAIPGRGGPRAKEGGCESTVDIDPQFMTSVVRTYLDIMKENS